MTNKERNKLVGKVAGIFVVILAGVTGGSYLAFVATFFFCLGVLVEAD